MSRLVLDRIVLRRGARTLGPVSGSFGPGVHGVACVALDDRLALEETLGARAGTFEGSMSASHGGQSSAIAYLGDLLPLPAGYSASAFAKLFVGNAAADVLHRCGIDASTATHLLSSRDAFALALGLVGAMANVGALLVPGPPSLVSAHDEREAAARLRSLAAAGIPVLVFLGPGANEARWVDDLLLIDERGAASEPRSLTAFQAPVRSVTVRGNDLEALAARLIRSGFELALDAAGTELTVRSSKPYELERALTDALAEHPSRIDGVVRCP